MAVVTVNSATELVPGRSVMPHRQLIVNIDLDDDYPTGGYPVPLDGVANANGYVIVQADAPPVGAYRFWWDPSASKLVAYVVSSDSVAEVADDFDLSGVTGLVLNCLVS
jgi:hypothetical protein